MRAAVRRPALPNSLNDEQIAGFVSNRYSAFARPGKRIALLTDASYGRS